MLPLSVHLIWIRLMSYVFTVPPAIWCSAAAKVASYFCLIIPNALVLLTLLLGQVTLCGKCTCLQQEKLSEITEHRCYWFNYIFTCSAHLLCRVSWRQALKFYLLLLPWHSRSLRQWCWPHVLKVPSFYCQFGLTHCIQINLHCRFLAAQIIIFFQVCFVAYFNLTVFFKNILYTEETRS